MHHLATGRRRWTVPAVIACALPAVLLLAAAPARADANLMFMSYTPTGTVGGTGGYIAEAMPGFTASGQTADFVFRLSGAAAAFTGGGPVLEMFDDYTFVGDDAADSCTVTATQVQCLVQSDNIGTDGSWSAAVVVSTQYNAAGAVTVNATMTGSDGYPSGTDSYTTTVTG